MKTILPLLLVVTALSACGGSNSSTDTVAPEGKTEAAAKPKANNPLAAEQQLIKDAEALQGILDQDAERKKQAVKDSN